MKILTQALICSLVVGAFAFIFHGYTVSPNNFGAVCLWLPLYISPIWGVAGISHLSERRKD